MSTKILEACARYEVEATPQQREEARKAYLEMVEAFNAEWDDREKRLAFTSEDLNLVFNI